MVYQSSPPVVYTLQIVTVVWLILIAGKHCNPCNSILPLTTTPGLSSCLSLWVMPLTKLLPPKQAAQQFTQTVIWGGQYLQTSSRVLAFFLVLTTVLTSRLPDSAEAAQWKTWTLCIGILLPVAPYEVKFIFWINDRIEEMGEKWKKDVDVSAEEKSELRELLDTWKRRNWGRVLIPLATGVVGLLSLVTRDR
jgi:hypothetical protein